jgi:hypothetical protein
MVAGGSACTSSPGVGAVCATPGLSCFEWAALAGAHRYGSERFFSRAFGFFLKEMGVLTQFERPIARDLPLAPCPRWCVLALLKIARTMNRLVLVLVLVTGRCVNPKQAG